MRTIAGAVLLLTAAVAHAAETSEEFAFAVPIHADGKEALYQIEVPAAVYQGSARSDLGDLRVFNGSGEVVPHALKPRAAAGAEKAQPLSLHFFPVYGGPESKLEGLDLRVEKTASGTIVNLSTRDGKQQKDRKLLAWLVDASSLKTPIKGLELDWRQDSAGFAGYLRVESSSDLAQWNTVIAQAPLVSLEFGGQRLEQKSIEFRPEAAKYLRLSWPKDQKPIELTALRATPGDVTVEAPRVWREVTARVEANKPGEYQFDLGGHFPVDRLRVALPEENTVAQAQLFSRAKPADAWRSVARTVLYRLRQGGQEFVSPELSVALDRDRYWLLRVDQEGGGLGKGLPGLSIGWVPQQLVFAARGAGPFQLAYGNASAQPAAYTIETLVPGYRSDVEIKAAPVQTGEQKTIAGPPALRQRIDIKRQVKTWALWGSLVLGVFVLGWMAYRLTRQMQAAGQPGQPAKAGPDEDKKQD